MAVVPSMTANFYFEATMAIRKFKVNVTREFEYLVELDDTKMDLEFQEEFNRDFHFIEDIKGHAENLAGLNSRFPDDYFLEGYGDIKMGGKYEYGKIPREDDLNINVTLLWEDLTTDCGETK